MNDDLLQTLQREVALLVVRLDEGEDRRQESRRVADGDVAGSESRRAANVLRRRRKVLDNLFVQALVARKVAAVQWCLARQIRTPFLSRSCKGIGLHDTPNFAESEERKNQVARRGLGGLCDSSTFVSLSKYRSLGKEFNGSP